MSNIQDIRRALEQRLDAGVYTNIYNADQIAWENCTFDPSPYDLWLEPRLIMAQMIPSVIGSGNAVFHQGFFTVNCYGLSNEGTAQIDLIADEVIAQFPYGTQIVENGKTINVRFAERVGTYIDNGKWRSCQANITWYAYIS